MYIVTLTITFRMNRPNQRYVLVLAVSLGILLLYITNYNQNEVTVDSVLVGEKVMGIPNKTQSILPSDKLVPNYVSIDVDCDTDKFFGDKIFGQFWKKTEYLEHRRACILKYCGDVCDTKQEYGRGKFSCLYDAVKLILWPLYIYIYIYHLLVQFIYIKHVERFR